MNPAGLTFACRSRAKSNEKQGYTVRLLLRRAMLEGFLAGRQEAFLHTLVPAVVDVMKRPYQK